MSSHGRYEEPFGDEFIGVSPVIVVQESQLFILRVMRNDDLVLRLATTWGDSPYRNADWHADTQDEAQAFMMEKLNSIMAQTGLTPTEFRTFVR